MTSRMCIRTGSLVLPFCVVARPSFGGLLFLERVRGLAEWQCAAIRTRYSELVAAGTFRGTGERQVIVGGPNAVTTHVKGS